MTDLKIHSDKAWEIASHWSYVLASDTRTLAAAIDLALTEERNAALEAAAKELESDNANGLDRQICCDGQTCGCQGSTVGEYAAHLVRALKEKP